MELDGSQRAAWDEGQGGIHGAGELCQGGDDGGRDPRSRRGALWVRDVIEREGVEVGSFGEEVGDGGVEGQRSSKVAETGVGDRGVRDGGAEDRGGTGGEGEFEGLEAGHVGKGPRQSGVEGGEEGGVGLHFDMEGAHAAGEVGVPGEEDDDEGVLGGGPEGDGAVEMALGDGEEGGGGAGEDEEVGGGEGGEDVVEELEGERHGWRGLGLGWRDL